jgi:hypothetical protein
MFQVFPQLYQESQEAVSQQRTALRTRLVWYVGISGYVLINSKSVWTTIAQREINGMEAFWLLIPWVISALFGAVTYFIADEAFIKKDRHFLRKVTYIKSLSVGLESDLEYWRQGYSRDSIEKNVVKQMQEHANTLKEMMDIIRDEDPEYKESLDVIERLSSLVSFFDRLTFIFLVIGFIWTIVGPLVLPYINIPR